MSNGLKRAANSEFKELASKLDMSVREIQKMAGYSDKDAELREQVEAELERLKAEVRREKEQFLTKSYSSLICVTLIHPFSSCFHIDCLKIYQTELRPLRSQSLDSC